MGEYVVTGRLSNAPGASSRRGRSVSGYGELEHGELEHGELEHCEGEHGELEHCEGEHGEGEHGEGGLGLPLPLPRPALPFRNDRPHATSP